MKVYAIRINSVIIKMVEIPSGIYRMGSCFFTESPPHEVTAKSFLIGQFPVTQEQWMSVMGENPSKNTIHPNAPVSIVSILTAVDFCKSISNYTGRTFRLPSEAEWEYACRAGSCGDYCFGNDVTYLKQYCWYKENSGDFTMPVGMLRPNTWGFYDMHGNVAEWCQDTWHGGHSCSPTDGKPRLSTYISVDKERRVLRGGSFKGQADCIRSASRTWGSAAISKIDVGFRVVMEDV
ncbi:MAG: formylglycine-generating enzyme family protein [bacterium]|nr:formylglycine-generating enzyme family protein [bacterium]